MKSRHNDVWADIAYNGRFMQVETTEFREGLDSGAFTQNPTEFVLLNEEARAVDESGVEVESESDAVPLEEQSGDYIISRRYGHIYRYDVGDDYNWGGDGRTYNFGNSYEETHDEATMCAVPAEDASFDIPALKAIAGDDTSEGVVSKSWGSDFTYEFGASYAWSDGWSKDEQKKKLLLKQKSGLAADQREIENELPEEAHNRHCEFSYGNGYAESVIDCPLGYGSGKDNHGDKIQHDAWNAESFLKDSVKLDTEKTFGNTYEYHYGDALDIHEGDAMELHWGNATEVHNGNSSGTTTGNSTEVTHGNSHEETYGTSTEIFHGAKSDICWGATNEMFMGAANEMALDVKNEMTIGAHSEIFVGAKSDISLSFKFELDVAFGVSIEGGKVKEKELEIEDHKLHLKNKDLDAEIGEVAADLKELRSQVADLQLFL